MDSGSGHPMLYSHSAISDEHPTTQEEVLMYGFLHPEQHKIIAIRARLSLKFHSFLNGQGGGTKYKFKLMGQHCTVDLKKMTVDLQAKDDLSAINNLPLISLSEITQNRIIGILKRGSSLPKDTGDQRLLNDEFVIDADSFIIAVHSDCVRICEQFFLQTLQDEISDDHQCSESSLLSSKSIDIKMEKTKKEKHCCLVNFKVIREHPSRLFKATDIRLENNSSDITTRMMITTTDQGFKPSLSSALSPRYLRSDAKDELIVAPLLFKDGTTERSSKSSSLLVSFSDDCMTSSMDAIKGKVIFFHSLLKSCYVCEMNDHSMNIYRLNLLNESVHLIFLRNQPTIDDDKNDTNNNNILNLGDSVIFEEYESNDDCKMIIGKVYIIPAAGVTSDSDDSVTPSKNMKPEETPSSFIQITEDDMIEAEKKHARESGLPIEYWKDIQNHTKQISMMMEQTQTVCGSWLPTISQDLLQMKSKMDRLEEHLKRQRNV